MPPVNSSTQNADPAEIAKFTALAQSWWDPNGPSKLLHELNPLRLRYVDRAVSLPGRQILDVGCGGGILSESMARAGARVLGIDLAPALIEVAQLHALQARTAVEYRTVAAEDLARERPGAFDAVTCMEMLEHVPDPAAALSALAALAKPAGDIIVSTLNRHPQAFAVAILGAEYDRASFAARHARIPEIHPALGARAMGAGRRPRTRGPVRHRVQPLDPGISPVAEYQRQLSRAFPPCRARCERRPDMTLPLRAILFDLDGTLLDTAPEMVDALNALRVEQGLAPLAFEEVRPSVSHGSTRLINVGFPDADPQRFAALQSRFLQLYAAGVGLRTRLFSGMDSVLAELSSRGLSWRSSPTSRRGSPIRCSRSSACAIDSLAW